MKQDTPPTITSDAAEDDDDGSLSPAQLGATLAELYRRNQLDSSSQQAATYEANENVNNKVMLWCVSTWLLGHTESSLARSLTSLLACQTGVEISL